MNFPGLHLSYPRRLFGWLLAYSALLIGCFVVFQYQREKEFKAETLNARLQLVNSYILSELAEGNSVPDMRLDEFHPFEGLRVSIIDPDGRLVYDNTADSTAAAIGHADRTEIAEAERKGSGFTVRRHSLSTGDTYFYSATRGPDGSVVRTAVPYSLSLTQLLSADLGFIRVMGAIAIAMCVFGFFATRRLGQHISRLNRFARQAERGERIADTEPFPSDELGQISNNIVRLYARLQRALTERDREHSAAIREQQEKQRIKKQLTANINHELKTPVAAMQICLETLEAHDDLPADKRREFIARCLSQSDRLRRLLADVATITSLDEGAADVAFTAVDLRSAITEVAELNLPVAEAKGFAVSVDVAAGITLHGNRPLLASVFQNLIDNALAYSNGSRIAISARKYGKEIRIEVADDGVGVAEEHLPHLFERFYRVDKGRSRAAGGTGLGLAIVKNAIALHRGSIQASLRKPSGLVFIITLPLD